MKGVAIGLDELLRLSGAFSLGRIQAELQLRSFVAGQYLYFESQSAEHLWIVRKGCVRTQKASPAGRITTLEQLRAGDLFGMAAVLPQGRYTENAQGVVAGEVWRAPRRMVAQLIRDEPDLGRQLLAIVAHRLQSAHDRLCSFAHDSVPARIARAVLSGAEGERLQATRKAVAEAVGTTVETAIRVLRSFERAGWVEAGVGWIRIVDRDTLEKVAAGEKPVV